MCMGVYKMFYQKTNKWRTYIFVTLGGVVKLQVTHSQGVGTQGSPPSFAQSLAPAMERKALRRATTNTRTEQ